RLLAGGGRPGGASLDRAPGRPGAGGRRRDPQRHRAGVHQGRDRRLRGSEGGRLLCGGARTGQGEDRGPRRCDQGWGRLPVPLQRLTGVASSTQRRTVPGTWRSMRCCSTASLLAKRLPPCASTRGRPCHGFGIEVVRRPTGGRAILHDRELTYSVALPASVLGYEAGILPSYRRLSLALQAGPQG